MTLCKSAGLGERNLTKHKERTKGENSCFERHLTYKKRVGGLKRVYNMTQISIANAMELYVEEWRYHNFITYV
jgi:hypothetical protein